MTEPVKVNFKIYQGSTFTRVLRWELPTKVYKTITAVYLQAPLMIQSVAHGVPAGWRVKLSNIGGTKELNSSEYRIVSDRTDDTLTFNDINAVGYTAYTSGGIIEYQQPKALAAVTARMQIREKLTSETPILSLTTENNMIVINDTNKTITITIPAVTTETLNFKTAVYSMEMIEGSTVTPFIYGNITLDKEITR